MARVRDYYITNLYLQLNCVRNLSSEGDGYELMLMSGVNKQDVQLCGLEVQQGNVVSSTLLHYSSSGQRSMLYTPIFYMSTLLNT